MEEVQVVPTLEAQHELKETQPANLRGNQYAHLVSEWPVNQQYKPGPRPWAKGVVVRLGEGLRQKFMKPKPSRTSKSLKQQKGGDVTAVVSSDTLPPK